MNVLPSYTLRNCLILGIVLASRGPVSLADDAADLAPAIVQQGKKATVFVDVGGQGSGSGFLVHASGIFVTNAHVVKDAEPGSLKLVINSGQTDQKTVSARVVLIDEDEDLALLKTDEPVAGVPLPLADDTGLVELAKAVVFGYPFGKMLAAGNEGSPSISINVGRISALRRDGAALERIQFDASTNPGNSGGPLIDKDGKVIGIIVSSVRGANVNFAIPAAKLIALLQKPVLSLRAPEITYARRAEVREFEVEVFPIVPVPPDAEIAVQFGETGAANRRSFPAVRRDGRLFVKAAPIDAARATAPLRLRLEGRYRQLVFIANFDDCPVRIGDRAFRLSELSRIERNTDVETGTVTVTTTLTHFDKTRETYETVVGNVAGLPTVHSKINPAVVVKFEDARRVTIGAYDAGTLSVPYEVTLSSKGKAVASSGGALNFTDLPHGLESDSEGRLRDGHRIIMSGEGLSIESLISPTLDVKQGSWVYSEEKGLETKAEASAWCEIPVLPQNEYTVHVEMTPKQSTKGEMLLQLPVGKASALLHIDGAKGAMKLDLAEARNPDRDGNVPIEPFVSGKKFDLRVAVRTDGKHGQILVWAEDAPRPLVWTGLIKNLSPSKGLPVSAGRLSLGHQNLEMTVASFRVGAEQGGLRLLRELPGAIRHDLNLVGRWSFDAPLTDNKMPSLNQGNPATLVGSPQIGVWPGVLGAGAMKLGDEAGSGFIVAESNSSTRGSHLNRTVSMWFRADAAVPANQRQYLYDEGGSDKGYALYLQGDTLVAGGWDPKAEWKGTWLKAPGIVPGQWYHVALVNAGKSEVKDNEYRNVDKNHAFRLYLNGTQVGAGFGQYLGAHELIAVGTVVKSTQACPDDAGNRAIENHQFVGMIDEVEILNGFMDPAAIPILAGGRFGINAHNDQPVVPPPAVPKPALAVAKKPAESAMPSFATIALEEGNFVPLVKGEKIWSDRGVRITRIPPTFEGLGFTQHKAHGLTLKFKVVSDGLLYLGCSARWGTTAAPEVAKDFVTEDKLLAAGWVRQPDDEIETEASDMLFLIYSRRCKAGEEFSYRTEKYAPPILLWK